MANPRIVHAIGPETHRAEPDLIALEIVRRHSLLLRRFSGIPCFFFIAKTFGQRCRCWDKTKSRVASSRCPDCYNTGFSGGFFPPIPGYYAREATPDMIQLAAWGELHESQSSAWTTNYPLLSPRDIVADAETGDRWRVESITNIEQKGYAVMQILKISKINPGDIEFNLKVPSFSLTNANDSVVRFFGGSSGDTARIVEDDSRALFENTWQWEDRAKDKYPE